MDAAWSLPSQVKKANSLDELLQGERLRHAARAAGGEDQAPRQREEPRRCSSRGSVLLNFSREGVVDDAAVLKAL